MELKDRIIKEIKEDKNDYFCYGYFHKSNMADYTTMRYTIQDLVDVYDINEFEAVDIVTALIH